MSISKPCFFLGHLLFLLLPLTTLAQGFLNRQWLRSGDAYVQMVHGNLVKQQVAGGAAEVFLNSTALVPAGQLKPLKIRSFSLSTDERKALLYTNTKKVWRYDTRGDYWIYDLQTKTLKQVRKGPPRVFAHVCQVLSGWR